MKSKAIALAIAIAIGCTPAWSAIDSTNGYITTTWTEDYGGPITVMLWLYETGATASLAFGGCGTDSLADRFYAHLPYSDNNIYWDYGDVLGNGRQSFNMSEYYNRWVHVALVSEGIGGSFRGIYMDGVLKASTASSDGPSGSHGFAIGHAPCGGFQSQPAKMADFRVYKRVLSVSEIQAVAFTKTYTISTQGLVGAWRLDELASGEASTTTGNFIDRSGNGYHGTKVNTVPYSVAPLNFP